MSDSRLFKYNVQGFLRVSGPDAQEFLQGQFSNDLSSLEVGQVVYGLWLDRKGKIVADSFVLRRGEEAFALLSYYCPTSLLEERLDAYLIMEEAELEASERKPAAVSVWSEAAQSSVCQRLEFEVPPVGGFSEKEGVVAFWGRRGSEAVLEIVCLEDEAAMRIESLGSVFEAGKMEAPSEEAIVAMAIEAKVPQIGLGFGEKDLPQELGLEVDAVSFRKGCYLGQEVMARLQAMGRVRKELRVLSIEDYTTVKEMKLPVDLLDGAGKRQGQLRSVAYSKSGGVGLGIVSCGFEGATLKAGAVDVTPLKEEGKGE